MKTLPLILIIVLSTLTSFNAETDNTLANTPKDENTKAVLDHHWKAFQANDLEGTMADYTEESILITPDKTFKGLKEIRENFIFAFGLFPKDGTTFTLDKSIVQDEVGYIIWRADAPKTKVSFGTDTFIIKKGKIIRQTFAGVFTTP